MDVRLRNRLCLRMQKGPSRSLLGPSSASLRQRGPGGERFSARAKGSSTPLLRQLLRVRLVGIGQLHGSSRSFDVGEDRRQGFDDRGRRSSNRRFRNFWVRSVSGFESRVQMPAAGRPEGGPVLG